MKDVMKYQDFIGSVHFGSEDEIFHGKIEGINDLVTFEGKTVRELKTAFHQAVDDYLEICKTVGKESHKSYKGSFNVRVSPELHKKAAHKSSELGISLNQFVEKAIEKSVRVIEQKENH